MCLGERRIIRNEASKQRRGRRRGGGHMETRLLVRKGLNGAALYCSAANGTLIQKADEWRSIVNDQRERRIKKTAVRVEKGDMRASCETGWSNLHTDKLNHSHN